jgi:hypothetical protein
MAAPRVILRFRELTPSIDTISEHEKIKQTFPYVWWGWWRKEIDGAPTVDLEALARQARSPERLDVFLIDTSAERLHTAKADDVLKSLSPEELNKVPSYYRGRTGLVYAWFRLVELTKDVPYDHSIEARVGTETFAILEPTP